MILFDSQTANGDSVIFNKVNNGGVSVIGDYFFSVTGIWDGATVTVHYSTDGINWSGVDSDATFTANGGVWVSIPRETGQIKAALSNAGASTVIDAELLSK